MAGLVSPYLPSDRKDIEARNSDMAEVMRYANIIIHLGADDEIDGFFLTNEVHPGQNLMLLLIL